MIESERVGFGWKNQQFLRQTGLLQTGNKCKFLRKLNIWRIFSGIAK